MRAILHTQYGPPEVLRLAEVEKPKPQDNQVLIKIHAASVNAAEWHIVRGEPFLMRIMFTGLLKPKKTIPGADIAGQVEAVGKNVTQFKPGDTVFGDLSGCGWGGFAEYVCAPETVLVHKPSNLSFDQAAAVPLAAVTALQGLRNKAQIQPGQKVLINGASGGVGTFAIQIAKAFGAEVTAVCSTKKMEMVRSLGADYIIDYTKEDFTKNGKQYDLILAANGYHPLADYKRALSPQGTYVMSGGETRQLMEAMLLGVWHSKKNGKKLGNLMAQSNPKDLAFVKELVEAGKVVPVIDRRYPLSEIVEALRYVEAGHAQGKVVIDVA